MVLPSRIIVALFVVLLLALPLITSDLYLLRIIILASIFAIFAASWDLLSGFTGQMNFGHALFFGVGAYGAAMLNQKLGMPPIASIPLGALAAVSGGLGHRHTLPAAARNLPGLDDPGIPHHPNGAGFCFPRSHWRRIGYIRL